MTLWLGSLLAGLCWVISGVFPGFLAEVEAETLAIGIMPRALLTTPEYYGTLAAVRRLGRAGIPITIAHATALGAASWSRYVSERHSCPAAMESDRFIGWLTEFGSEHRGHVLCPTSDDTAFLYALHRKRLSKHFHVDGVSVSAIYSLLNKRRLFEACTRAGIDSPRVFCPEDAGGLRRVAEEAKFPLMIKPATQILFHSRSKGDIVREPAELERRYARFSRNSYGQAVVEYDPEVRRPLLQEFFPDAAENIYNLSGFVDERGRSSVFRASTKVLQHPRRLGVGLCFEQAPVRKDLAAKVEELCRSVGYHGVFEVEFIRHGDRHLLIDFNPRFYSQMAFDIGRGLDLALLAYYAALGQRDQVERLIRASSEEPVVSPRAHLHRLNFEIMLRSQKLSGVLSDAEEREWRRWYQTHRDSCTDAALDPDDALPGWFDALRSLFGYVRHPRAFYRMIVMNR